MKKVIIMVDEGVEEDALEVGGAVVLPRASNELIGWAIGATPIRVHDAEAAGRLEESLVAAGVELRRWHWPAR